MKKLLMMSLMFAFLLNLAGCGDSSASGSSDDSSDEVKDSPVTLVVGNVATGDENPYNMAMNWASEWLKENNSTVSLNLQLQGVMGSETEQAQQVALGNQDICQIADMSYTNIAPKMAFANFPMLLEDYDDMKEAWGQEGWIFEQADKILGEANLKLLGAGDNGFRIITNSKHPVEKFEDMAGLKIRVPENQLLLDIWNKFGCQTSPVAFGELTAALQQKTVDGQELGLQHFYSNRWDEFQSYLTQINYDYSAFVCCINLDKFNSLSAKQQEDLMAAFAYGCEKATDYCANYIEEGLAIMEAEGLIESEMTDEFRDQIYKVGYELAHEDEWMSLLGEELVNIMYPSETRS